MFLNNRKCFYENITHLPKGEKFQCYEEILNYQLAAVAVTSCKNTILRDRNFDIYE